MSIVRISADSGIPIPQSMLARLGTQPGQQVMLSTRDGTIVLTPVPPDPIEFLCGVLTREPVQAAEPTAERAQEVESK